MASLGAGIAGCSFSNLCVGSFLLIRQETVVTAAFTARQPRVLWKQKSPGPQAGWQQTHSLHAALPRKGLGWRPRRLICLEHRKAERRTARNTRKQPLPMGSSLGRSQRGRRRRRRTATQLTHIDGEVLGGAGDVARGRQRLWYVLQSEGGRADLHGQPHHQVPLGASECPAVTWMYVRLGKRQKTTT